MPLTKDSWRKILPIALSIGALVAVGAILNPNTDGAHADVGNIVSLKYPDVTVLCSSGDDALAVYVAGARAAREAIRIDGTAWSGANAQIDATREAMRQHSSCFMGALGSDNRFTVKQKRIVPVDQYGAGADVAAYCLLPANSSTCLWHLTMANTESQFSDVQKTPQHP